MNDIVTAIGGIVLLITIFGCIPYGVWIIYSLFKKQWKRVGFQIAIPVTVYACLAGISTLTSSKAHADYLIGLCDVEVELGPAIFKYDSDRSFNGGNYSGAKSTGWPANADLMESIRLRPCLRVVER